MTITAVLLAHYPERKSHIKKIVKDLQNGTRVPDEIIVFVDNPEMEIDFEGVRVIKSDTPFPVTARMHAASFANTDYVFLLDDDQTVEVGTIAHFEEYAKDRPYSVLGFEGSMLRDTENPYTDGVTINKGNEVILADVLIRSWFVPKPIIGLSIYMHDLNQKELGNKYHDDLLICLSNRLMQKHSNWVIPHTVGKGLIELGNGGVGQSLQSEHYTTRNRVCKTLIERYQNDPLN